MILTDENAPAVLDAFLKLAPNGPAERAEAIIAIAKRKRMFTRNGKPPRPRTNGPNTIAAQRKAQLEARPVRVRDRRHHKDRQSRARLDVPVGAWIEFTSRSGIQTICKVIAVIPKGQTPQAGLVSNGPSRERLNKMTKPAIINRYLVQLEEGYCMANPTVRTVSATEVEDSVQILPGRPDDRLQRSAEPLAPGTEVRWPAATITGAFIASGIVLDYIPAGRSLYDSKAHPGGVDAMVDNKSGRDRYLIKTDHGRGWTTVAALIVERFLKGLDARAEA